MKILKFELVNAKAIRCWAHECPNGEPVKIAGDTGVGKTTAASALWSIMEASPDVLRHGATKGRISLTLGDGQPEIIATRRFTKKSQEVIIERADGGKVSVAEFKTMISRLAVNPHRIKDMKPTERVVTLLASAGIDMAKLDEDITTAERVRLESTRRADDNNPGAEPEKVQPIDVSALADEIQHANQHNASITAKEAELQRALDAGKAAAATIKEREERLQGLRDQIAAVEASLEQARKDREAKAKVYVSIQTELASMVRKDTSEAQAKLASANAVNAKAGAYADWNKRRIRHEELTNIRQAADEHVRNLKQEKIDKLAEAKFPLPGISVEGTDITYHGVLFDNLGESEQILVCASLAIKDILAHPIHVARIDGVESLSAKDEATLGQLFDQHGIQIISTRVARGAIEDGELTITECQPGTEPGKASEQE